jgi:hypothetical protein
MCGIPAEFSDLERRARTIMALLCVESSHGNSYYDDLLAGASRATGKPMGEACARVLIAVAVSQLVESPELYKRMVCGYDVYDIALSVSGKMAEIAASDDMAGITRWTQKRSKT